VSTISAVSRVQAMPEGMADDIFVRDRHRQRSLFFRADAPEPRLLWMPTWLSPLAVAALRADDDDDDDDNNNDDDDDDDDDDDAARRRGLRSRVYPQNNGPSRGMVAQTP